MVMDQSMLILNQSHLFDEEWNDLIHYHIPCLPLSVYHTYSVYMKNDVILPKSWHDPMIYH